MKITHLSWNKVGAYTFHSKETAQEILDQLDSSCFLDVVWTGDLNNPAKWGIKNGAGCWVNDFS